ncbi:hypothetical protein SAMN02745216_02573 [Desulfatibacillum alkenivorans DSM 16219]|jgi:hypothetical protein|uniref:Uncharacterized protein n=1 Tax=Desulfatibacillum alkenivorans DSM 16219 TaxID=1121393 RepID=A0A1M6NAW2_9BACT|nr:hypothetical protein [Desulfatibacillum alkenivorans]SHJ92853.1 hypothetical protein SAMN02745216_02573 [Desulfatibacillum alkenivorans DSM 16219]
MGNQLFYQHLASFKEREKPEGILLIADEPQLIKLAVAWTNIHIEEAKQLSGLEDDSECGVWNWLWENTIFSKEDLIAKSGALRCSFDGHMHSLIGNRILYPDGSLNSFVQRYLRDRVLRLFDAKPKKNGKK